MKKIIRGSLITGLLLLTFGCSSTPKATTSNTTGAAVSATTANSSTVVATVGDKDITDQDLEFYKLLNQIQMEILKEEGQKQNKVSVADEQVKNLEKQNNDKNTLLTQAIRLQAMSLLAKEKGYSVDQAAVQKDLDDVKKTYDGYAQAKVIIDKYGADKFWAKEKEQYELISLVKKVQNDMKEKAKKENPNQPDKEIEFQTQKNYEELLQSQISSLKVKINNNK
ncbi:MAG TPA: hypothetical protein VJ824_01980 [Bacillota bacterium]|nr:hypothetical protein [Bacillota bacterium]